MSSVSLKGDDRHDVGAEAQAALERKSARLAARLAGVRVAPRFPSPLIQAASP